jgi:branched-chain amino acid transport system permease protein
MINPVGVGARLVVVGLLALAPLLLGNFRTFLLTEILIFGLFAASLDLLLGFAGMPSLGQATYLGAGAYAAALVALHWTSNVFVELGAAIAAGVAFALVTGLLAVRTRGVYFLMLTLAFGQLLYTLAFNWNDVTGGSNGLAGLPPPSFTSGREHAIVGRDAFYYYVLVAFLLGYAFLRVVVMSPFGRALRGIRENEGRMRSLGYWTALYKLVAFCIAGGVAGFAGALTTQQAGYVSPSNVSLEVSVIALIAVIIGGTGTLLGPVLGAALYYILRDELSNVFSEHWRLALGIVFVAVVYFMPYGLVGLGRRIWGLRLRARPRPPAPAPEAGT